MAEENTPAEGAEQAPKNQFAVQRIYVKDISFESPLPVTARPNGKPELAQDLHTQVEKVADNHYEVVLHLTITVKQEGKVLFLVEVHQAGLFLITGLNQDQLRQVVSTTCPTILFPYAREAIDSLAIRGGFQPVLLPPINFDAVYAQSQAKAAEGDKQASASSEVH